MTVFDENGQMDVLHSSSIILSESQWTDLSDEEIKTLNGLRRLYSDHKLLSHIDTDNELSALWNDVCDESEEYVAYSDLLQNAHGKLLNQYDSDGNLLLEVDCLDDVETSIDDSSHDQSEDNPLVSILQGQSGSSDGLLLEKLSKFYAEHNAMNDVNAANPEIVVKSKCDHGGLVKSVWMNITIELFSDNSLKYPIGIGPHSLIFINNKPVKLPQKYGYQKKTKPQSVENAESVSVHDDNEDESDNDGGDKEIMNTFEQLSQYDASDEFGIDVVRYEKGKVNQRHDFLKLIGALKEDIFDISVFVFGYNAQTNAPFIVHKRMGPDALPISAKRRQKKKRIEVQDEEKAIDMTQILKRREFVFVTDNDDLPRDLKTLH